MAQRWCICCTEAAKSSEKSAVGSGRRVPSLCELFWRKALLLQCACSSLRAQPGRGENWATQLTIFCLPAQVSTYTGTYVSHTHPLCQSSHCFTVPVRLKTVDVLMKSLQAAESQVKKYEARLSEEDIVPADTASIRALREQIQASHINTHTSTYLLVLCSLSLFPTNNSLCMAFSVFLFICSLFKMKLKMKLKIKS